MFDTLLAEIFDLNSINARLANKSAIYTFLYKGVLLYFNVDCYWLTISAVVAFSTLNRSCVALSQIDDRTDAKEARARIIAVNFI